VCTEGGATAPSTTAPSAKFCVVPSTWLFLGPLRGPMGGGGAQPFSFRTSLCGVECMVAMLSLKIVALSGGRPAG